jgi:hypothetical protein
VSILVKRIFLPLLPILLAVVVSDPRVSRGQDAAKAQEKPAPTVEKPEAPAAPAQEAAPAAPGQAAAPAADLPRPPDIPKVDLVPTLPTVKVRRDRPDFSLRMVNASLLPRDKEGIWVLDFAFKPLRIRTVEIPGKGRRPVHYLYYKVVNRTGKPRMFIPQFVMVNEEGKKFEDQVIPHAIPLIQAREDATIPVRGAVDIMGVIPPSTKEGVDDAVFGAAVWEKWDPKSDRFSIYVRGLSDGYKEIPNPSGGKPIVKYKTLRIDFIRRGDERNINEREIELSDPPYEWVYW